MDMTKEKNFIIIRELASEDVPEAAAIWNRVVEDGEAFPQTEPLSDREAAAFFGEQSFTAVAWDEEAGKVTGIYILHPNNVGRCGHICNASYAVKADQRGKHIGEALVRHCLAKAKELGFSIMQFNAVVKSNLGARHLYEKLGFVKIGEVPGGFHMKDGHWEDIVLYYYLLH